MQAQHQVTALTLTRALPFCAAVVEKSGGSSKLAGLRLERAIVLLVERQPRLATTNVALLANKVILIIIM